MAISNAEKMNRVHAQAMADFDRIISASYDERMACLADRRFVSVPGAQWEGSIGDQFENKPKLEVNKIALSVMRIINEYRNNRIAVDFVAKSGGKDDHMADVCDGLLRADEQACNAEEAYDNAFEEAVTGGMGAWRLRAVYEDEEDEEKELQRIAIEPIFDADSCVFFDPDARRQDKSDAKYCYVLCPMTPEAYEEQYNDSPSSWDKRVSQSEFDWCGPDLVYVAEYYKVEDVGKTILTFKDASGDERKIDKSEFDEDEELQAELEATGYQINNSRRIKAKKVHKYIMSGGKILDDCGFIAGTEIPIVVTYGKRWFIDGVERCMGHVRLAKDAQMLKNMQLSKLAELASISSTEKPIFTTEQIAGHELRWAEDNVKNFPYLTVNSMTDAMGQPVANGPIGYTKPPQIAPAMAALLQLSEQDMAEILGNPSGADKMVSNISGKAVELIQTRLDMQSYIYMSNFAKAMKRSGEIWLGMAKEIIVEEGREMQTVGVNGETGTVTLMKPIIGEDGGIEYENDLASVKFGVSVEVGPTYQSQRESLTRALTSQLQATTDPETQQVIQSMLLMNLEGEGMADMREWARRKLVGMGVVPPTAEDKERLEEAASGKGTDPQAQLMESMAKEAEAKALKATAEVTETTANAELKRAQTVETLAGIEQSARESAANFIQPLILDYGAQAFQLPE